jgi:4-amino-4-deoxy-L-arabinose transferase-like glycosyltransferase
MADGESKPARARQLAICAALALLALALYLPSLGRRSLDNEEGRRAIPAREMLASGDFVRPTVFGRLYLAKPPLSFWSIAACASLHGEVDELAARLPSAIATALTAVMLAAFGARVASARAGAVAAVLFLLAPEVLAKGVTAEIEPLLGACTFAATAALWLARERSIAWTLASGAALALALLAKGPPALLFFAASALAMARALGARWLATRTPWIALALGLAGALAWVALLFAREPAEQVIRAWTGELGSGSGETLAGYLDGRARILGGLALGFGPATWLGALSWRTQAGRDARAEPLVRAALWSVAIAAAFFLVAPPARARYLYPSIAWACVAAGRMVDLALGAASESSVARRARRFALAVAVLGFAPLALGAWLAAKPIRGFVPFGALAWSLAVAAAAVGGSALARRRASPRTLFAHALAIAFLLRLAHLTHVVPHAEQVDRSRAAADAIELAVPAGATLWTTRWDHFNELFYVDRDVRFGADAAALAPGSVALVGRNTAREIERGERRGEVLLAPGERGAFAIVRID